MSNNTDVFFNGINKKEKKITKPIPIKKNTTILFHLVEYFQYFLYILLKNIIILI